MADANDSSEELREKQFLWTARAFAVFAAVSLCSNVVVLVAIFNVLPLEKITPYYVDFNDRADQVVTISSPGARNLARNDTLTESLVRKYVMLRSVVVADAKEMENRWGLDGPIRWMSDPGIYGVFSRAAATDAIWNEGRSREVKIASVLRVSNDVWQVQLETQDMRLDVIEPTVSRWTVTMRVAYKSTARVKYAERLKNPLGFTVMAYSVQRMT